MSKYVGCSPRKMVIVSSESNTFATYLYERTFTAL